MKIPKDEKGWQTLFKKRGRIFPKPHEDLPRLIKVLKKEKAKKILDLGCGSGRHVVYLAKQGFDVYGTDNAKEGLKLTKEWVKKLRLKAHLKFASFFRKFPFKDRYFDLLGSSTRFEECFLSPSKESLIFFLVSISFIRIKFHGWEKPTEGAWWAAFKTLDKILSSIGSDVKWDLTSRLEKTAL